jgi:hypothetical protein
MENLNSRLRDLLSRTPHTFVKTHSTEFFRNISSSKYGFITSKPTEVKERKKIVSQFNGEKKRRDKGMFADDPLPMWN